MNGPRDSNESLAISSDDVPGRFCWTDHNSVMLRVEQASERPSVGRMDGPRQPAWGSAPTLFFFCRCSCYHLALICGAISRLLKDINLKKKFLYDGREAIEEEKLIIYIQYNK